MLYTFNIELMHFTFIMSHAMEKDNEFEDVIIMIFIYF